MMLKVEVAARSGQGLEAGGYAGERGGGDVGGLDNLAVGGDDVGGVDVFVEETHASERDCSNGDRDQRAAAASTKAVARWFETLALRGP